MDNSKRGALAEKLDADLDAFIELKIAESADKRSAYASSQPEQTVDELAAVCCKIP